MRSGRVNADGTVVLSDRGVKALRILLGNDPDHLGNPDRSPSVRELDRVLSEAQCDPLDREVILHILGLEKT